MAAILGALAVTVPLAYVAPPPVRGATILVTSNADSGIGSLRQAILDANSTPEADVIDFAQALTITPATELPTITAPITIDGAGVATGSEPGIVIDGSLAGAGANGLTVGSGSEASTIRALRIVNFSGNGLLLTGTANALIEGNFIGTDGTASQGNVVSGISLTNSPSNTIRGNVISGQTGTPTGGIGITINDAASSANEIAGNLIGTNAAGTDAIGNAGYAINIGSPGNIIGGATPADRNVISGNGRGIHVVGTDAHDNVITGNYIGTNAAGTAPIPNGVHGIVLNQSGTGNRIGGTAAGEGNVIAASDTGILIEVSSGATIQGNLIGVGADGTTALGNATLGIQINGAADPFFANDNAIGGTVAGAGNVIANSGLDGIRIQGNATGNRIQGNRIVDNGELGIDLGVDGVTPNDLGDGDVGPNALQNFPLITDATADGTSISGTLDGDVTHDFVIEVFQSDECDDSGNGEGQTLLGTTSMDGPGPWSIDEGPVNGTFLTAVAIDITTDDTSEFGPCFEVTDGLPAPGTWVGEKSQSGGGAIPGDGDVMAAGMSAPAGPAQFTYGALDPDPAAGASSPSGEWFFYTTAAATGTISVPVRWTGFHGFAGVDVLLEAIVIRDLDEQVFTDVVVDEGPVSCDPCIEPSGGFDYDDSVDFPVEAGDIYGFRITSSNDDTNASLYGQLVLGAVVPQDCADAQDLYGETVDGRYFIHPQGGQEFSVHCADMEGETPDDYLNLGPAVVGPGFNFASYAAGGAAPGSTVTTTFEKLRIDPATLLVDIGDLRFATSTGSLTHPDAGGDQTVTSMSYATAMACSPGGPDGTANIDLRGTPFAIDDTWVPNGTAPTGSFQFGFEIIPPEFFVTDPQQGNVTGNGFCGWNSPRPDFFFAFNPSPGDFSLQLRYLNASATPPAPVLFRAAPNATNTATGAVGRLNAAPGDYTVTLYASTSCTDGLLGDDAVALGTADVTIGADDQTYFSQLVNHSLSTRRFVALTASGAGGGESERSACIVAQADNDVWPRAAELTAGGAPTSVSGWIDQPAVSRWYKFNVDPGAQLTINLADLPADYDVFLFKDIQQAYDEQAGLSDNADLTKLSAEFAASSIAPQGYAPQGYAPQGYAPQAYAPQAYAPEEYAPQAYAPQGYAPQAYAPQGYAPQAYAPQGYAPQGYAPQAYAPQAYAPQAYAPDIFAPQAYAAAQVTSLVAIAAHTGTGTETIVANTWNNTGEFYVRVSGKNGVFSTDAPFDLDVSMQSQICSGLAFDSQPPMVVAGAAETLILTDLGRMSSATQGNGQTDKDLLTQRLSDFSLAVNGTRGRGVVDVNADLGVRAMNLQADAKPSCPFAKNLVANEIKDIVDAHRTTNPALKYVVLVGGDDVIPFFRYADQALLGPEQDFVPPVDRTTSSEASLRSNYVLGQDEYGSSVVLSHGLSTLPIPDLSVGRLVETAADASIAFSGYLALADGVVPTPTSSLVTGYDFIADASDAIKDELELGIGTGTANRHDELITPFDVSPLDPASWTATSLRQQLATRHDLLFLGGHFSADSALAADFSTSITTADLPAGDVLTNAIVFSIGCHAGYNTVDGHAIDGVTQTLDWPQAFARKRATLIAGTGYQYGDTDFIEYSERIYLQFARELRTGNGPIAVGDALVRSKQTYLRLTNDLRGLHEKALLESALYGLPMVSVDMPGARLPAPDDGASIVEDTDFYEDDPGATLDLLSADVDVVSTLTVRTKQLEDVTDGTTVDTTWYSGPDGVVTHQNEPAIPLDARNVSVQDEVLRGVLWTGGEYTDETVVPLTGAPATETRGVHTRFASPVFYPIRPWSANYTGALTSAGGPTHLLVTPAQHKGSPTVDEATLRTYQSMGFKLFYSSYTGVGALSAPPEISTVSAAAFGDVVTFQARVAGDPAVGVQEVWVLYTTGPGSGGSGTWVPLQLTQDELDSTLWRGTVTITGAQSVRYLVQAVNGLGLVTMSENYGEYYEVGVTGAQPPPPVATTIAVSGPTSGAHAEIVSFSATLTQGSGGPALPGKTVVISAGGISRFALTNPSGVATVELPLLLLPGSYTVSATFPGDAQHESSSASRAIGVTKAPTTLTLIPTDAVPKPDGPVTFLATLTSGDTRLAQRTLALLTTSSTGSVTLKTVTTNLLGEVAIVLPAGMNGIRQIEVRFGSLVSAGGVSVDLRDTRYLPSSAATWPFTGFQAPVNNRPTVNVVKAGSAVPVRFSLGGDRGLNIFRAGYPKVVPMSCQAGVPVDDVESTVTANSSGLLYAAGSGEYTYVWKAPKKVGCYRLELAFTDGTVQAAEFKLR